jgi:hypothetical protein
MNFAHQTGLSPFEANVTLKNQSVLIFSSLIVKYSADSQSVIIS